jgi:uridine kinase
MCLGRDEVAIFEGIHALSDRITALHPNAYRLYISARSNIERDGALFFKGTWVRLTRRAIRDAQFRGADAQFTLSLWRNVRRGEKAHISPFKDTASLRLDTLIPYEISLMRGDALRIFSAVPPDFTGFGELHALIAALTEFPPLDASLAPPDSMLREFIGGGIYEY